jgi:heptose-I-phosphate ethanolaminephosphotransferase
MLTTAPFTTVAVPSMLSLRPITDWNSILAQRSIVSAFREAGFMTYWLSSQEADSWSGVNSRVAAEAKHVRYFDRAFDSALLNEFRTVLDASAPGEKLFLVLHSLGSHFEYSRRYPPAFARFKSAGSTRRDQLVDSYDNSVLYTDWFLGEIISTLSNRNAILFYASDHGENLLDDGSQLLGHAIGNQFDLRTAAFVWNSQSLRSKLPKMSKQVLAHAGAKLSVSNLPHSLLDLAGIEAEGLDRSMSIFSSNFTEKERWFSSPSLPSSGEGSGWVRGSLHSERDLPACYSARNCAR